jgi:hypothetical protein
MKKRINEILKNEIMTVLGSKDSGIVKKSLSKLADLADIFDQSGDTASANKLDTFMKEAGFWSSFFSGLVGGGGAGLWDALKSGKIKESIGEIVKKALIGAGTGVVVEYIIKGLDEIPLIGPYLKELGGADKLRSMLEGIIAGAVAESDLANKLVDKTIEAIEGYLGMGGGQEKKEAPEVKTQSGASSSMPFQYSQNSTEAKK